jgi:intein-encoded DNA endonuclease-like protein
MRDRDRILANLEGLYREAHREADKEEDRARMKRLDFDFQRDQLHMELLMDIRDLLSHLGTNLEAAKEGEGGGKKSLLEKAQTIRKLTRLRP